MAPGNQPTLIDRSIKALVRQVPAAFLRLAETDVGGRRIHLGDVSVNLPEFSADQVLIVGDELDPSCWAMHLEYVLQPDERAIPGWFLKAAALNAQLRIPVILTAVYLTRGGRTRFPSSHLITAGGLSNEFRFHTIRLWEHADRIRSGELRELAPLLVLCEDEPTERTLQEERRLILDLNAPKEVRSDLFALALSVGARYFGRESLLKVFREEVAMLKEAGLIEEWIAEGEERGRAAGIRQVVLRLLRRRFGQLPSSVIQRVENEDPAWCEDLADRILDARSLVDLGLE